jgi:hypothetical protein
MKRFLILLSFVLALLTSLPLGAAAQNRAIEALANKYSDRAGFSSMIVKGDISTGFVGSLNIEAVDISNIIRDISSIVVVRSTWPDADFSREVTRAVADGYSTVMSSSSDGDHVRFLLSDDDRRRESEFVIVILGDTTNLLVSIVGDYKLGKVSHPE